MTDGDDRETPTPARVGITSDDVVTSPGISPDLRRRRRSSTATIDAAELLLAQLRGIDGVTIPIEGPAALAAHGQIRAVLHRVYRQGVASADVGLAELRTEVCSERERREAAQAWAAHLKRAVLRLQSGELTARELWTEVSRPSSVPPPRGRSE